MGTEEYDLLWVKTIDQSFNNIFQQFRRYILHEQLSATLSDCPISHSFA
jgi:hypothetical protein